VWCDRDGRTRSEKMDMIKSGNVPASPDYDDPYWNKNRACEQHIKSRNKRNELNFIMSYLQSVNHRPRYCKNTVILDHYKWTHGLYQYLHKRAVQYKKKGLHWWKDSRDILLHMRHHNQSICVTCSEPQCINTLTNTPVNYDEEKVFFGRRDHYGKTSNAAKKLKL